MNQYKIAVFRNGHSIAEYDIDADAVVEFMRCGGAAADDTVTVDVDPTPATAVQAKPKVDKPRFEHGCPQCGSLGRRHKKGCSRAGGNKDEERYPSGGRKPMKRAPCTECGSKGARHKTDCSKAGRPQAMTGNDEWAKLEEAEGAASPTRRISRMNFGRVKISQSHDIPADVIARNLDEPVEEIEKAFNAETYDVYSTS